jgi:two-component system, probable response regulator PhcQ
MPGMSGSEFLALVYQRYPETVRIILTGHADLELALRAINQGHIYRFLVKPVNDMELKVTIRQAIQHKELIMESRRLLNTVRQQRTLFNELEKENPGITKVKRDELGAVILEDAGYDPDQLVEEINQEIMKWKGSPSKGPNR